MGWVFETADARGKVGSTHLPVIPCNAIAVSEYHASAAEMTKHHPPAVVQPDSTPPVSSKF